MGEMQLTLSEQRIYDLLSSRPNGIVKYAEFESVICCKLRSGRWLLRVFVSRLRKRGLRIENVKQIGYRYKPRKPKMHMIDLTDDDRMFAAAIQDAIGSVMEHYAGVVNLESQIAILGVAIGAFLNQLPAEDCEILKAVLFKNVNTAHELSQVMRMQ